MVRLLRSLKRNFRNPFWWRDNIIYNILKLFERNDGMRVLEEDWNSLIILDSCRFDSFRDIYLNRDMKGELERRISRGTWTVEFLRENFTEGCEDIVYVTSNPYVDRYIGDKLYKVVSVWKYGWSEKFKTVLPSEVYRYALRAIKKYSDRRLVIHFMQPHHPYLVLSERDDVLSNIRRSVLYGEDGKRDMKGSISNIYSVNVYAEYDIRTIIRAYEDNLRMVIPYVEALLNELPGKTVITSDHGESFGDRIHPLIPIRFYGHGFTRLKSLVEVPWLVVSENQKNPYKNPKDVRKEIRMIERKFRDEKAKIRSVIRRF